MLEVELTGFGTIATAICYDIRFPQMISYMTDQHPDICAYLLPSAFNMSSGPTAWEVLQRVRSVGSRLVPLSPCLASADWLLVCRAIDNQIYVGMCSPAHDTSADVRPSLAVPVSRARDR